jgi:hypothetical protein
MLNVADLESGTAINLSVSRGIIAEFSFKDIWSSKHGKMQISVNFVFLL